MKISFSNPKNLFSDDFMNKVDFIVGSEIFLLIGMFTMMPIKFTPLIRVLAQKCEIVSTNGKKYIRSDSYHKVRLR